MSERFFSSHRDPRRRVGASLGRLIQPSERAMASRQVRQDIVSLVGLVGRPVLNQAGDEVGRVVDLVAKVHGGEKYPVVTGIVIRVARRQTFLDASAIDQMRRRSVTLRTARLDLREFQRREGEVLLARDILDHQLVDTDEICAGIHGSQSIRYRFDSADFYLRHNVLMCERLNFQTR